jgi:hypothetical protein
MILIVFWLAQSATTPQIERAEALYFETTKDCAILPRVESAAWPLIRTCGRGR